MNDHRTYQIGNYDLHYSTHLQVEFFDEPWYRGIIFYVGNLSYQVIRNYAMRTERLLISQKGKYVSLPDQYLLNHDMPLKPSTFCHLPHGVTIEEIE
jgi:hypothetical protein